MYVQFMRIISVISCSRITIQLEIKNVWTYEIKKMSEIICKELNKIFYVYFCASCVVNIISRSSTRAVWDSYFGN